MTIDNSPDHSPRAEGSPIPPVGIGEEAHRGLINRLRGMFGADPLMAYHALPLRVRRAIEEQEARAEILIGWIQLAIVSTFAILYALAAKPDDAVEASFQPVPIVLAAYACFTLFRLLLAYRRFTPSWFLVLSILVDFALLYGLIWSFHLQYNQPAVFYLKVPTLLYVFIFIAIRALRFDPRYVISAGVVAAGGWLLMLWYAVASDAEGEMITRDFTVYLTSNTVLIGAEFDKVISIILVSGILTLALARARRLLVGSVTDSTAAGDLKRFFPEIADAITQSSEQLAAGQGEARDAVIAIIDIRGFTRFASSIPPGDVVRLLAGYQGAVLPVVRKRGGTVDKFLGDGIMVTFGASRAMADPVAAAMRTLEEVVTEVADAWNASRAAEGYDQRLTIKGAVTTGRVVYGAVGDATRLEFTVIGDAVNLAAKLEKHTASEGALALTTEDAWQAGLQQGFVPQKEWLRREGSRLRKHRQTGRFAHFAAMSMSRFHIVDHQLVGCWAAETPNQGDVMAPRVVVLHYTAMHDVDAVQRWLCSPESQVSAHLIVDRTGDVRQIVRFDRVAAACRHISMAGCRGGQSMFDWHRVGQSGWLDQVTPAGCTRGDLDICLSEDRVLRACHPNGKEMLAWERYPDAQLAALDGVMAALRAAYPALKPLLGMMK